LVALLTALTYLLAPDSGDRIGLGITIVLSLSVYQLIVADKVPPTCDSLPFVGIYFGSAMVVSAFSLACTIVVHYLYRRASQELKQPRRRTLAQIANFTGKHFMLRQTNNNFDDQANNDADSDKGNRCETESETGAPSQDAEVTKILEMNAKQFRKAAVIIDRIACLTVTLYLSVSATGVLVFCILN